ncbi:MAG: hypothetical protein IKL81_00415 [Clostridia bacterium]|nr:hypothetical protein [Clostridia bacterium]
MDVRPFGVVYVFYFFIFLMIAKMASTAAHARTTTAAQIAIKTMPTKSQPSKKGASAKQIAVIAAKIMMGRHFIIFLLALKQRRSCKSIIKTVTIAKKRGVSISSTPKCSMMPFLSSAM